MKVLVIGSGGREHALAWKLSQSPVVEKIFCAPGNAGMAEVATCVPITIREHAALIAFAQQEGIGLTVVGPDDALAAGIVDAFQAAGLTVFGPTQAGARLESSKAFAKDFMRRHGIPTARAATFSDPALARAYLATVPRPVVIKADGLALGKGVIIAQNNDEADAAIREIMEERRFGEAGREVVIEECLTGPECSVHALVDGHGYLLFPGARDHKRAYDGDQGPNTGGMGTVSAPTTVGPELEARIRLEILEPFVAGLKKDGLPFRGMLFPGLMLTPEGPKVLEFNCRFGDPETQVLLARLESDLLPLLLATAEGRLAEVSAQWRPEAAVCVIMASGGYPGSYPSGVPIHGLEQVRGATVFHAGTKRDAAGQLVTAGGRVLGVTALGADFEAARAQAYAAVQQIEFAGAQYRTDIGLTGQSPAA